MKHLPGFGFTLVLLMLSPLLLAESNALSLANVKTLKIDRGITEEGKACITCHQQTTPGHVADWKDSRHAHAGISCIDCHQVAEGAPHAMQHVNVEDTPLFVSPLVSPKVCGRCQGTV
jgi:hydroxylamine dehydrogenase